MNDRCNPVGRTVQTYGENDPRRISIDLLPANRRRACRRIVLMLLRQMKAKANQDGNCIIKIDTLHY